MRAVLLGTLMLAGCGSTAVVPLSNRPAAAGGAFAVATNTAPLCTGLAAQQQAMRNAAIAVIQRGGDRFEVLPATGEIYGGSVATPYTGVVQGLSAGNITVRVRMLNPGDPGYAQSQSARVVLGPNWQALVMAGPQPGC